MIGRRNHHRVNILAGQHFAKITGGITAFIGLSALLGVMILHHLLIAGEFELVHVANRDHVRARRVQKGSRQVLALLTTAEKAQRDSLTRRRLSALRKD